MKCKVCGSPSPFFGQGRVLAKYDVNYFQCCNCGFIQTDEPYWLAEAYSDAISDLDLGVVSRGLLFSRLTRGLLLTLFDSNARFMDYGAGYGLFVRAMRDTGFDFYHYDKYCPNLLAKGFEADLNPAGKYELTTAFEVFEHFVDPLWEIEQILGYSKNIFISTLLVPTSNPKPSDWWYYALEHGQHIALYTARSLEIIAHRHNLNFYTDGNSLHLFTSRRLPPILFKLLLRNKVALSAYFLLRRRLKQPSLLTEDTIKVTGWNLESPDENRNLA